MKRGFTLVELVVVLAVIAAMTHLAVRELSRVRDGKLGIAADRQLETIRDCVYSHDGGMQGFLADMGRLPRSTSATNATLRELWTMPEGARPYAVLPATEENLVPGLQALANAAIYVPTGWRGPYLRLPFGKSRLLDPWGNPVETPDSAELSRLEISNGWITAVSHFGPTAQKGGERKLSLVPDGGATSRMIVTSTSSDDTEVCWYGPASGLITGAVATVSASAPAVFSGLTPGRRILVYKRENAPRMRAIDVRPGDNLVPLEF